MYIYKDYATGNNLGNESKSSSNLPDILKLNEGFHHDLKDNDIDELRGPTFPCNSHEENSQR